MNLKLSVVLSREDISKMPFDCLYEYSQSSDFKTGTQRRRREAFFTKEELELLPTYIKKANNIYHSPRTTMEMSIEEKDFWNKIGKFLYENWCIK